MRRAGTGRLTDLGIMPVIEDHIALRARHNA
jgi:hypothetical protein